MIETAKFAAQVLVVVVGTVIVAAGSYLLSWLFGAPLPMLEVKTDTAVKTRSIVADVPLEKREPERQKSKNSENSNNVAVEIDSNNFETSIPMPEFKDFQVPVLSWGDGEEEARSKIAKEPFREACTVFKVRDGDNQFGTIGDARKTDSQITHTVTILNNTDQPIVSPGLFLTFTKVGSPSEDRIRFDANENEYGDHNYIHISNGFGADIESLSLEAEFYITKAVFNAWGGIRCKYDLNISLLKGDGHFYSDYATLLGDGTVLTWNLIDILPDSALVETLKYNHFGNGDISGFEGPLFNDFYSICADVTATGATVSSEGMRKNFAIEDIVCISVAKTETGGTTYYPWIIEVDEISTGMRRKFRDEFRLEPKQSTVVELEFHSNKPFEVEVIAEVFVDGRKIVTTSPGIMISRTAEREVVNRDLDEPEFTRMYEALIFDE